MLVSLPYKILVQDDVLPDLDKFLLSLKLGKKCILFCSENIWNIIGKKIKDSINSFDADIINPVSLEKNYVKEIAEKAKNYDFFIGIGGGRTIDLTKYVAFLSGKGWIAFPTILSHDGVVSSRAVINEKGSKISIDSKEPAAIIADINTIKKAPYRYIAAGAGDLISKYSAVEDWKIADRDGKEKYHTIMARLSLLTAEAVTEHANEIRSVTSHGMEILLWSLICSGFAMNIYGSSRPGSGSEHNFSHVLEKMGSQALHGEQVALGTIISVYLQRGDWKKIQLILKELGLPTTAKELGISREEAIKALVMAKNIRDRYTILDKYEIDENKAEEILHNCGVI